MWMIDGPNMFSPRSEIMAFLKESEDYLDCPEWQQAAARALQMLAKKDAWEAAKHDETNWAWTVTVPSPFAPRSKLQAFIKSMEMNLGKDDPGIQCAVARVRGYLAEADQGGLDADSTVILSPATQSTPGWFSG